MSNPVVEVHNLRKTYGQKVAVADLSFAVAPGEIFGILGPNGSGKSTAVECIAGLRDADSGHIRVLGIDPQTHPELLREHVGVQFQEAALHDKITVHERSGSSPASTTIRPTSTTFLPCSTCRTSATPNSGGSPAVSASACLLRWLWSATRRSPSSTS